MHYTTVAVYHEGPMAKAYVCGLDRNFRPEGGREGFMVELFVLTVVGGIIACAVWDGMKAVVRKLR